MSRRPARNSQLFLATWSQAPNMEVVVFAPSRKTAERRLGTKFGKTGLSLMRLDYASYQPYVRKGDQKIQTLDTKSILPK